jgi:hypothetical protein
LLTFGRGKGDGHGNLPAQLDRLGLPGQIGSDYVAATAHLLPNCQEIPRGYWSRTVRVSELKPQYDAFRRIIFDTRASIEQSSRERSGPSTAS